VKVIRISQRLDCDIWGRRRKPKREGSAASVRW